MSDWQKIIWSCLFAFSGGCFVRLISLLIEEQRSRRLLQRSLYRELASMFIELKELPFLDIQGPIEKEPAPLLDELINAQCFCANRSNPTFWRLKDCIAVVKAHNEFAYLRGNKTVGTAARGVQTALGNVGRLATNGELDLNLLVKVSQKKLSKDT